MEFSMGTVPPPARCVCTVFDEVECTIPYHPELIARWKDGVPGRWRRYDPGTKAWRFWGGYQDVAVALLLAHFPDADVPHRARTHATPPVTPTGSDPFAVLHLRPTAPRELIDAAYRCLAKLHHPDLGGDPARMRLLTDAHETLSRRLSA
jgi:hypothetical protein